MPLIGYLENYQVNLNWFPNVLYGFMFSLSIYLGAYRNLDASTDFLEESGTFAVIDEYDFIVGKSPTLMNVGCDKTITK